MLKNIIQKLCVIRNKLISRDDFTWSRYHKNYANQIKRNEGENTLKLSNNFEINNGELKFLCSPPLTKNAEILYRVVHDLNPESILEVGCGGGDHMYNLQKIIPDKKLKGCDLLQKQLDFLNERSPELKGKTFINDITKFNIPFSNELVYTQAVIMHIQKNNRHLKALMNLFKSSTKYIVLMENWTRHDFYGDLKYLSNDLFFPWKNFHMYKVDDGKQIIVVLSQQAIKDKKLKYSLLKSNEELLKYLK